MKKISSVIFKEGGEWWYRQPSGNRQRARVKVCETCLDKFVTYPIGATRFCSRKCWRRPCKRCGETFTPKTKRTEYCSLRCSRGVGTCEQCGKEYVYSHHGAKRFCSKECFYEYTVPVGAVVLDSSGYSITKVSPGTPGTKRAGNRAHWMWSHRYVMQQKLGRTLLKTERVHHINGKRGDNRPENLELWKRTHPAGVRSADYHCAGCRCFEGQHDEASPANGQSV